MVGGTTGAWTWQAWGAIPRYLEGKPQVGEKEPFSALFPRAAFPVVPAVRRRWEAHGGMALGRFAYVGVYCLVPPKYRRDSHRPSIAACHTE